MTGLSIEAVAEAPKRRPRKVYSTLGLEAGPSNPKEILMPTPDDVIQDRDVAEALGEAARELGEGPAVLLMQAALADIWQHRIVNQDGVLGPGTKAIINRTDPDALLERFAWWCGVWRRGAP
jgi:hypothetical protein